MVPFWQSIQPRCGSGESWLITMRSVTYVWRAASDYALHHHHEEDLAFIPSAEPAHPPAIDTITQDRRLAETQESGLDLQFLQSGPRFPGRVWGGRAAPAHASERSAA